MLFCLTDNQLPKMESLLKVNLQWKPFLISFIAIFVMVSLPKLGLHLETIQLPGLEIIQQLSAGR